MNRYRVTYLDGRVEYVFMSHIGVKAALKNGYKVEICRSIGYSQ